ncbi:MAG: CBS domain-containing protein [Lewinellaceae bacterium]|nr:CBS domain-containing protein [Lewinellaceae bacterium]
MTNRWEKTIKAYAHCTSITLWKTSKYRVFGAPRPQNIEDCMKMMSEKRIRHLPVVEDQKVVGILSVSDIVTAIMHEQENRIQSLEQYITGY